MLAGIKTYAVIGGVALFVAMAGFSVIQWQARKIDHLTRVAQDQQKRAERAEATVHERDQSIGSLEQAIRDARERVARYAPARRAVDEAPSTRACVDSPAVRAALGGMRAARGVPASPAGAARTVPTVPAPADPRRPR